MDIEWEKGLKNPPGGAAVREKEEYAVIATH